MFRCNSVCLAVRLTAATFVENPINRVASITLQLSRSSASEDYGLRFRKVQKGKKSSNLKLSQVPAYAVDASPILEALFPDKGRIYAGSSVFLTAVNGVSGASHSHILAELKSGVTHSVCLSVQMGSRRTVRTKAALDEHFEEVDEVLDEPASEGDAEIAVKTVPKKGTVRARSADKKNTTTKRRKKMPSSSANTAERGDGVDEAVAAVLAQMNTSRSAGKSVRAGTKKKVRKLGSVNKSSPAVKSSTVKKVKATGRKSTAAKRTSKKVTAAAPPVEQEDLVDDSVVQVNATEPATARRGRKPKAPKKASTKVKKVANVVTEKAKKTKKTKKATGAKVQEVFEL